MYAPSRDRVWQGWLSDQKLGVGPDSLALSWTPPAEQAAGAYSLFVGVFSPGWGELYGWDADALGFLITGASSACSTAPRIAFASASATPPRARPGAPVTLEVTLAASCRILSLVDFEAYAADGRRASQGWQDNVVLTGQTQRFQMTWLLPAQLEPATYDIDVGVFRAGWRSLYGWEAPATQVVVAR